MICFFEIFLFVLVVGNEGLVMTRRNSGGGGVGGLGL